MWKINKNIPMSTQWPMMWVQSTQEAIWCKKVYEEQKFKLLEVMEISWAFNALLGGDIPSFVSFAWVSKENICYRTIVVLKMHIVTHINRVLPTHLCIFTSFGNFWNEIIIWVLWRCLWLDLCCMLMIIYYVNCKNVTYVWYFHDNRCPLMYQGQQV